MNRKSFLGSVFAACAGFLDSGCRRQPRPQPVEAVPPKTDLMADRVLQHNIAAAMLAIAYIGDRLGLFRAMNGAGPMTAAQLAAKTRLAPRYVLEWLRAMASSGYLEYQAASATFHLPAEYAAVLVDEDSPSFLGGFAQGTVADIAMVPRVMDAFRSGKGIPYGDYPPETFESIERSTRPDYLHLITQQWIPAIPGMSGRLRSGGRAADIGCGAGIASLAIARAFPMVMAFGFETYAPSVARARQKAQQAGLRDRVRFDIFDGVHVPGGPYDLVTMNYTLHHVGDPVGLLRSTRSALAPGGALLIVDYKRSDRLEDDLNTPRQLVYAYGVLECLPSALAEGGPGFGTGIAEQDTRRLAREAGFRSFTRILPEDPIRSFFVLS